MKSPVADQPVVRCWRNGRVDGLCCGMTLSSSLRTPRVFVPAGVTVLLAGAALTFSLTSGSSAGPERAGKPGAVAPLSVGEQKVPVTEATCTDGVCVFDLAAELPSVSTSQRSLPLADVQVSPGSLTVAKSDADGSPAGAAAGFTIRDGKLVFDGVEPGFYRVTAVRNASSAYMFVLEVK